MNALNNCLPTFFIPVNTAPRVILKHHYVTCSQWMIVHQNFSVLYSHCSAVKRQVVYPVQCWSGDANIEFYRDWGDLSLGLVPLLCFVPPPAPILFLSNSKIFPRCLWVLTSNRILGIEGPHNISSQNIYMSYLASELVSPSPSLPPQNATRINVPTPYPCPFPSCHLFRTFQALVLCDTIHDNSRPTVGHLHFL